MSQCERCGRSANMVISINGGPVLCKACFGAEEDPRDRRIRELEARVKELEADRKRMLEVNAHIRCNECGGLIGTCGGLCDSCCDKEAGKVTQWYKDHRAMELLNSRKVHSVEWGVVCCYARNNEMHLFQADTPAEAIIRAAGE